MKNLDFLPRLDETTGTSSESDTKVLVLPDLDGPGNSSDGYRVVIYNDDHTPVDAVIKQIIKATECTSEKAVQITLEAHNKAAPFVTGVTGTNVIRLLKYFAKFGCSAKSIAINWRFTPMTSELEAELHQLVERLLDTNTRINLTAIRTPEEAWIKHILDSLEGLSTRLFVGEKTAVDVGSGPGFPGLPLALSNREIKWSFLDATRKKLDFVRETSEFFNLGAKIIHARAEEIGHDAKFRSQFDIATARAVGNIVEVAEYCLPLVKPRGHVILWRGKDAEAEAKEQKWPLSKLGGVVREIRPYELEGHKMTYHLVVLEKASPTPKDFPRAVGVPKASPLK